MARKLWRQWRTPPASAGFQYYGVADHSQSAHYAGGLSLEEIAGQHREADRLNKRYGDRFRILKGIEADILADGAPDYPHSVLEDFDFVVASVHSRFKLPKKEQTERILAAIRNPHTTIIGHMTGRQLQRRPGYEIDIDRILKTCAKHGVAIEINAHPWRLDLDWRWHQKALDYGCIFSINPDAHSIRELDHMHWGVEMARKGGVPADRVLNAMPLHKLLAHLGNRKRATTKRQNPARARAGRVRAIDEHPSRSILAQDKRRNPALPAHTGHHRSASRASGRAFLEEKRCRRLEYLEGFDRVGRRAVGCGATGVLRGNGAQAAGRFCSPWRLETAGRQNRACLCKRG